MEQRRQVVGLRVQVCILPPIMVSMLARRGVPHAANFILRECRRVVYGNFVTSDQKQSGDPADGRLIYLGAHTFGRSGLFDCLDPDFEYVDVHVDSTVSMGCHTGLCGDTQPSCSP